MSLFATKVEAKGLHKAFKNGELLPWKKISFMVEKVTEDRIVLRPLDTTGGFKKHVHEKRG